MFCFSTFDIDMGAGQSEENLSVIKVINGDRHLAERDDGPPLWNTGLHTALCWPSCLGVYFRVVGTKFCISLSCKQWKTKLNWLRWESSYMIWKPQIAFQRFKVLRPGLIGALCVSIASFDSVLPASTTFLCGPLWGTQVAAADSGITLVFCTVQGKGGFTSAITKKSRTVTREIGHCGQEDPIMLMTLLAHLWNCSLDQSRQTTGAAWSGKRGRGRGTLSLQVLPGHHPERRETVL